MNPAKRWEFSARFAGVSDRVPGIKKVSESQVTLHQLMLPADANALGNVHGGVILKVADEAAAICAMRHARRPCVTVAIDSVSFLSPVHVGELLALTAALTYVGRTSMEVRVQVHAENPISGVITHTNSAYFVFVALDAQGVATGVPGLELETDEQRAAFAEGQARQSARLLRARR
jgi:acyl-CoA hydrolase